MWILHACKSLTVYTVPGPQASAHMQNNDGSDIERKQEGLCEYVCTGTHAHTISNGTESQTGCGKMTQLLSVFYALAESLCSIPSSHIMAHNLL